MNSELLKEKNQLSSDINIFDGIISVQQLQMTIKQSLATNDELYFVDEIEKIVNKIGKYIFSELKNYIDQSIKGYDQYINHFDYLIRFNKYNFNKYCDTDYYFLKNAFIVENVGIIKKHLNKLKIVLLPIGIIQNASENMALKVISRLMINTNFYGKKDDNTILKNASALKLELQEFSYYSIQKGIKEYCRNNKDYPALKDLIDIIEPKNQKGLLLFANIQFLLSL